MANSYRKPIEKMVLDFMDIYDPSGKNKKWYIGFFKTLTDKDFDKMMDKFAASFDKKNDDEYLMNFWVLHYVEYESPNITENMIQKAAKFVGVPIDERIALPHLSTDINNPLMTPPIPTIWVNIKKMEQTSNKKNSTSTTNTKRNKYNQVTGKDKNGRSSDCYGHLVA